MEDLEKLAKLVFGDCAPPPIVRWERSGGVCWGYREDGEFGVLCNEQDYEALTGGKLADVPVVP